MGKLDRYFEEVARIKATGVSTNRWVTVIRDHDGDFDVDIRPGMLRRCTRDEVASEIRTALLAAVADHRRQYRQLRIDYFGSPVSADASADSLPAACLLSAVIAESIRARPRRARKSLDRRGRPPGWAVNACG